jgi:hypothetical protein
MAGAAVEAPSQPHAGSKTTVSNESGISSKHLPSRLAIIAPETQVECTLPYLEIRKDNIWQPVRSELTSLPAPEPVRVVENRSPFAPTGQQMTRPFDRWRPGPSFDCCHSPAERERLSAMHCGALWSGPSCELRRSGPLRPSTVLSCEQPQSGSLRSSLLSCEQPQGGSLRSSSLLSYEQPQSAGRRCGERRRAWPGARLRCAARNSVAHVSELARLRGRRAAYGGCCASLDLLHRRTLRSCGSAPWPDPFVAAGDRPQRAGPWKGQSQSPAGRTLLRVCHAESCGSPCERTHPPASWALCPRASLFEPS